MDPSQALAQIRDQLAPEEAFAAERFLKRSIIGTLPQAACQEERGHAEQAGAA